MALFGGRKREQPGRRRAMELPLPENDSSRQFRRNQTLSGRRPADDPSPRAKTHHLARRRRQVGAVFLIVLAGIIVLAALLSQFTARVIVGSSTAALNREQAASYEKIINDYLGIHPVGRLRFILNEDELSAYAASIAPEVDTITQTAAENLVETHYAVSFRRPIASWHINNRQYYVDSQGVVFERNFYAQPGVQIIDESGVSPEQGSTVASRRLLGFVGRVVALAGERGYTVTQARLPVDSTRQLQIKLKGVKPLIALSIDRGAGEQVEDMARALQYLRDHRIRPSVVDVRVSGRAVYR